LRFVHGAAKFRRQHDALAIFAQDLPKNAFRSAALPVSIGGIEKRDPHIQSFLDDFAGGLQVDTQSEVIAAQADDGDFRAGFAKFAQLHRAFPSDRIAPP